jgi:hypothetical protein
MKGERVRNLESKRFGKLVALYSLEKKYFGNLIWMCKCDCGNEVEIPSNRLMKGDTKSCGCLRKETAKDQAVKNKKHGYCASRTYKSWQSMKARCMNPTSPDYEEYGGRGITVCDRWKNSFENFLTDMGERPKGMTLDRKENDRGYFKNNCRWATPTQQQHNRRDNILAYRVQFQEFTNH